MAYSDIARTTLVCSWLFTGLATISMIAQVLSIHHRKAIDIDDYLLFTAYLVSVLLVAQTTWAVVNEGQGEHEADVSHHSQFGVVAKSVFANEILWGSVNTLLRLSATLFIRKVFGVTDAIRRSMLSAIILSAVFGIVLCITPLLVCQPISAAWDPSSSCDETPSFVALEAIGLGLDFGIAIMPVTLTWRLNLPVSKKLALSLVFSVGGLVIIVTALRLKALHMVSSPDLTYDKGYLSLLSNLGALVAITTCSAPAVFSLCRRLWEDGFLRSVFRFVHLGSSSLLLKFSRLRGIFMSHLRTLGGSKSSIAAGGTKNKQIDSDDEV